MAGISTVRTQRSRFPLLLLSFAFIFRHHGNNSSAHLPHSTSQQLNHCHSANHTLQSKLTLPHRRQPPAIPSFPPPSRRTQQIQPFPQSGAGVSPYLSTFHSKDQFLMLYFYHKETTPNDTQDGFPMNIRNLHIEN